MFHTRVPRDFGVTRLQFGDPYKDCRGTAVSCPARNVDRGLPCQQCALKGGVEIYASNFWA